MTTQFNFKLNPKGCLAMAISNSGIKLSREDLDEVYSWFEAFMIASDWRVLDVHDLLNINND